MRRAFTRAMQHANMTRAGVPCAMRALLARGHSQLGGVSAARYLELIESLGRSHQLYWISATATTCPAIVPNWGARSLHVLNEYVRAVIRSSGAKGLKFVDNWWSSVR